MTEIARRRKTPKPPIEMDVRLLDWASRGSTLARADNLGILVDRGIPGERVLATVDRRRKPWRGVVDQVLDPSPERIPPPCSYYLAGCGGCQWQHLRYETQVRTKRALVDRELRRAGVDIRVDAVEPMADPWRYRHTAAIALGWEAGFRPRGRRGIVEIHDCPISHPLIGRLADRMNALLRQGSGLPNYHGKVWLDCTVVGTRISPGLQVVMQGITGLTTETHPEMHKVARSIASIEGVRSVAFRHRSGEVQPLVGDLTDTIEIDGRMMHVPAGAFFQANVSMVPRLLVRIGEAFARKEVRKAADIYGGVGTFGLPLARHVEHMVLVELDASAVEAARRTASDWGLTNVEFISRHAERTLPELPALDAAILDPPRSGLGKPITDALIANEVPLLIYVSCAPSSLADDLAALQTGGYRVSSLEIFDFYPQTYHVESLAILER